MRGLLFVGWVRCFLCSGSLEGENGRDRAAGEKQRESIAGSCHAAPLVVMIYYLNTNSSQCDKEMLQCVRMDDDVRWPRSVCGRRQRRGRKRGLGWSASTSLMNSSMRMIRSNWKPERPSCAQIR